jgi:hypothetical protein
MLSACITGGEDMDRNQRRTGHDGGAGADAQQSDLRTDLLRRALSLPLRQDQQINLLPVWKVDRDRISDGDRAGR